MKFAEYVQRSRSTSVPLEMKFKRWTALSGTRSSLPAGSYDEVVELPGTV